MRLGRSSESLDHVLAAICAVLALVAAGIGAARPQMGYTLAGLACLGALVAYILARRLRLADRLRMDVTLYAVAVILAIGAARSLNEGIGVEGYPRELWIVPALSWMLVFGSLFAWRDTTLNFQLVPCIAMFGLVTAWEESFGPGVALFSLFLICAAALFFRSHARTMLLQAEASGVSAAEAERSGAWRWMAGPGWALSSAVAVLILAATVAPLLQASMRGFSGVMPVALPRPAAVQRPQLVFGDRLNALEVGVGPAAMMGVPVLRADAPGAAYLRGLTFSTYLRAGWRSQRFDHARFQAELRQDPERFGIRPDPAEFRVEIMGGIHDQLYVPGLLMSVRGDGFPVSRAREGTVVPYRPVSTGTRYSGRFHRISQAPTTAPARFPENTSPGAALAFASLGDLSSRVVELAIEVAAAGSTDWERAELLREFISRRAVYNLRAPPVPRDACAVDSFLFETREGYCDLFATSMVMMARAAGLPSRLATGFLLDPTQRDAQGWIIVRDSDYHAWAEVFFEGVGWAIFDATEGAAEAPGGGRRQPFRPASPWWQAGWVTIAVDSLLAIGIAAVVAIGLYGLAPKGASWRAALAWVIGWFGPRRGREEVERLFIRYQGELRRRTRRPRRLGQTPGEYVERYARELGDAAPLARELNAEFTDALFGPEQATQAQAGKLAAKVRAFRSLPRPKR